MNNLLGSLIIPLACVAVGLVISTITDIRFLKIPNRLTASMLAMGFAYQTALYGGPGFMFSVAGTLVGFLLLIVFYAMGFVGAGDVKIVAAMGAWIGPTWIVYVFIGTSLCLGAWRIGHLCGVSLFVRFTAELQGEQLIASGLRSRSGQSTVAQPVIPYTPNLCVGFLVFVLCWYI